MQIADASGITAFKRNQVEDTVNCVMCSNDTNEPGEIFNNLNIAVEKKPSDPCLHATSHACLYDVGVTDVKR